MMNLLNKTHSKKTTILLVTTIPETIFSTMEELVPRLLMNNFNVIAVASQGQWLFPEDVAKKYAIPFITIPFTRVVSPLEDLKCLFLLLALLLKTKPEVIHYSTPKAALLSSIASWITHTPLRVYTVRGIVFMGKSGVGLFVSRFLNNSPVFFPTKYCALANPTDRIY